MHLLRLFIFATKTMLSHMDTIMTWVTTYTNLFKVDNFIGY